MPHPESLSDPVHFTRLRHMARSPAHYRAAILEPRDPTPAMRFGSIVHAVLFWQPFVVWPKFRRGKDWEAFESDHVGELILTQEDYDRAHRMADSIAGYPHATRVLSGMHEVEIEFYTLGRHCAGRLDVLGDRFVTELKSTTNAEPDKFRRGALSLAYHAQLAWYLDGIGHSDWPAHVVAVEVAPPFAVTVLDLTPRLLDEGRKLYRLWMEQLLVCEASDAWPAYAQTSLPWDFPESDDEPLIIDGDEVAA